MNEANFFSEKKKKTKAPGWPGEKTIERLKRE
jgi:hypothetical protein